MTNTTPHHHKHRLWFVKKKWLIVLIALLIAVAIGFFKYSQPVDKTGSRDADFKLTSVELFNEFEANEAEATKKYQEKVIEVCGKITAMPTEEDGSKGVVLDGGGMLFGVTCRFEKQLAVSLKQLEVGDDICVKGVCSGMLTDVVMIRCVLENQEK